MPCLTARCARRGSQGQVCRGRSRGGSSGGVGAREPHSSVRDAQEALEEGAAIPNDGIIQGSPGWPGLKWCQGCEGVNSALGSLVSDPRQGGGRSRMSVVCTDGSWH